MESILDIIFPKKCINCGKLCNNWVCTECFSALEVGKIEELKNGEIKMLIFLFSYDEIRDKVLRFKFNDDSYIKNYFVELVSRNERIKEKLKNIDLIIPVPMYFIKKIKRGYNQSELIASGIAKKLNIKMKKNVLIKYKNTKTQSLLNLEERKNNLKECFKLKNIKELENKNILLVDDIYTTGTTISECVKVLSKSKLKSISVLVIAKKSSECCKLKENMIQYYSTKNLGGIKMANSDAVLGFVSNQNVTCELCMSGFEAKLDTKVEGVLDGYYCTCPVCGHVNIFHNK